MINAKEELIRKLKEVKHDYNEVIYCAIIHFNKNTFELSEGYNDNDFQSLLNSINFEYENGYGDEPSGFVWLTNGAWLEREEYYERGEYHGFHRWVFYKCPKLPNKIK